MSPTARTLALLREEGYMAEVVEKFIPQANVRKDLFGFGDVLGVHPIHQAFLIAQATTISNLSARLKKACGLPELTKLLQAGGLFEVFGWVKRNGRWYAKRVAVRGVDHQLVILTDPPRQARRPRGKQ